MVDPKNAAIPKPVTSRTATSPKHPVVILPALRQIGGVR